MRVTTSFGSCCEDQRLFVRTVRGVVVVFLASLLGGCPLLYELFDSDGKTSSGVSAVKTTAVATTAGSTSSGLNLDGTTWTMDGDDPAGGGLIFVGDTITFSQTGSSVVSTDVTNPLPLWVLCESEMAFYAGEVTGSGVSLTATTPEETLYYTLSGTSSPLSGSYEGTIYAGPCAPATVAGWARMTKLDY